MTPSHSIPLPLPAAAPPPAAADIDAVFREKGIPMTRQRRQVWEFFALGSRAATIPEATDGLREAGIGQATVYRTVTLLTDLGLLVRVQDRRGDIGYTAPPIGHSHPLVCGLCRRVVRFDGEGDLTALEAKLAAETGFAIYGHHLEVYGVCAACRGAADGVEGTSNAVDHAAGGAVEGTSDAVELGAAP
jgi:Fur family transcriptional regulator, ferric uptake regulator